MADPRAQIDQPLWYKDAIIYELHVKSFYDGNGDECHMAFHFPIMPRLFMAIRMEDRFPIMDVLEQSFDIPANCQWGMFLRNHDELMLEMVTDEERDYMYRVYAQDLLARINVGIRRRRAPLRPIPPDSMPEIVRDFIGPIYTQMVGLLGQRTGELHLALMSLSQTPTLTPEPLSLLYQKSLYQSIRGLVLRVFSELDANLQSLTPPTAEAVRRVLGERKNILSRVYRIMDRKITAMKIRTHGDYHLGQVLYTGKDFVIIDFEGEPNRPITERRLKKPALRDIAGMIRSFHYAAHVSLFQRATQQGTDVEYLRHWADLWYTYVSGLFLHAYLKSVAGTQVVPSDEKDFAVLIETFVLEKAVYELGYELNNRPDWMMIAVHGMEQILK